MTTKFAIVGVGCIGCCVGISLGLHKYDVMFIGRKSAKFDEIENRKSLSILFPEQGATDRRIIFVSTKRTANIEIAEFLSKYATENAIIIPLQNGIETSKVFNEAFTKSNRNDLKVVQAVVNFNAIEISPGSFQWISKREDSIVTLDGKENGELSEELVCSALRASGCDSYVDKNFIEVATGKLLINLINAPNALAGCDTFEMLNNRFYRKVWACTVTEARSVFQAMGVSHQRSPRDRERLITNHLEKLLTLPNFLVHIIAQTKQTKGGKTSMLQDLENKVKETEIDFLTGKIVELGKIYNVKTPVSEKLVELIKEATVKMEGSPKYSGEILCQKVGLSVDNGSCSIS